MSDNDEDGTELDSDEETKVVNNNQTKWYQFNVNSYSMQVWDSFFALVVLENIIVTPLSICFPKDFHNDKTTGMNWLAFEIFLNILWAIHFFINLNRVDFIRKITSFKETSRVYLRFWLIPDAIALFGACISLAVGSFRWTKYFDLIRLMRF